MKKIITALLIGMATQSIAADLLIDDFSRPGVSALGTQWQGFTDRVMGGRSTIQAGYVQEGDANILAMRGNVSLANNGGFVQVRLPLADGRVFDASEYGGIAIEARGREGSYAVHLRTVRGRAPWQYHEAELNIGEEWSRIEVPFSAFTAESMFGRVDTDQLISLAIVAGKVEFFADIEIRRIEFIR